MRGMEIQKVGIAGISYDEESQKLINMRNEGAMLGSDFNVMRGMAVKNITEGVRDAGSNANGAMAGFMGVGMGMNAMNQTPVSYTHLDVYKRQELRCRRFRWRDFLLTPTTT